MAEQLQLIKKILMKKYIKTGTTPVFIGELEKLRGHWDAFVEYIQRAPQRLREAMQAVAEGKFQPDRERDELTYALGNPEHPGRTRGKGVVPWKYGFRDYIDYIEIF